MLLSCLIIYPLSAEAEQNGTTYSGTATSWGYNPECTSTIKKRRLYEKRQNLKQLDKTQIMRILLIALLQSYS